MAFRKIENVTVFMAWAAYGFYIASPFHRTLSLPGDVRIADVIASVVVSCGFFILIHKKGFFPKPAIAAPVRLFFIYLIVVLVLPLFGIMFYDAPLEWYYGDLRWLPILFVGFVMVLFYRSHGSFRMFRHFTWFLLVIAGVQHMVLASQVAASVFGAPPNAVLELWYPGGQGGYGKYGYHIHRYAAGLIYASGLALFGAIAFVYAAVNVYVHLEKEKAPDYKLVFLLFSGLLFIVAAGTRAMLFGMPVAVLLVLGAAICVKGRISFQTLAAWFFGVLGVAGLALMAFHYNIGRIASGDRLLSTFRLLTGEASLDEIAGRGGARWSQPLYEAFTEWGWHGTLANASHAMAHLPAIDSYIVFSIAQGGPFIIIPFLLLCITLAAIGLRLTIRGDYAGGMTLGLVLPIMASALTQNTMTGLSGRIFLTLVVCGLWVWRHPVPGHGRSDGD